MDGETKPKTTADGDKKPEATDPPTSAQRGAARAKVTKSLALLNAALAERNPETIKMLLPLCKDALKECLDICESYREADYPEKDETNEEYSSDIIVKYASVVEKANGYIEAIAQKSTHSPPITSPTHQPAAPYPSTFEARIEQMCDMLSMPETPLDVFDGDILQFNNWWTVFKERIDMKNVTPMIKLNKLLFATQGEPHDLISFCKGLGGEEGYKTACEILESTYDDPDAVSKAYIDNLKNGQRISNPTDFLRLGADLRSTSAILTKHDRMSELQNQNAIKTIVMRLPNFAILKWRKIALGSKFDSAGGNKYPSFQRFVDFVVLLAKEARDSTWGDLSELLSEETVPNTNGTDGRVGHASCNNVTAGAISRPTPQVSQNDCSKCSMCEDSHSLPNCSKFQQMSAEQRVSYAFSCRLCFRCLSTGHIARECLSTVTCTAPNCGKPHSKWLHTGVRVYSPVITGVSPVQPTEIHQTKQADKTTDSSNAGNDSDCSNSASCINAPCNAPGSKCVMLPLVGVQLGNHNKTEYVLLDRGSQRTVIEASLVEELGLSKMPTNSVLEGIWGSNRVESKVEFEIKSTQNGNRCYLDALVVPKVTARHPPKHVDLSLYPYLADLPIVKDHCQKARILIGLDNAHLLFPLDTKHCGDLSTNTLFGEKTYLGWALNGPLCDDDQAPHTTSCGNVNLQQDSSSHQFENRKVTIVETAGTAEVSNTKQVASDDFLIKQDIDNVESVKSNLLISTVDISPYQIEEGKLITAIFTGPECEILRNPILQIKDSDTMHIASCGADMPPFESTYAKELSSRNALYSADEWDHNSNSTYIRVRNSGRLVTEITILLTFCCTYFRFREWLQYFVAIMIGQIRYVDRRYSKLSMSIKSHYCFRHRLYYLNHRKDISAYCKCGSLYHQTKAAVLGGCFQQLNFTGLAKGAPGSDSMKLTVFVHVAPTSMVRNMSTIRHRWPKDFEFSGEFKRTEMKLAPAVLNDAWICFYLLLFCFLTWWILV